MLHVLILPEVEIEKVANAITVTTNPAGNIVVGSPANTTYKINNADGELVVDMEKLLRNGVVSPFQGRGYIATGKSNKKCCVAKFAACPANWDIIQSISPTVEGTDGKMHTIADYDAFASESILKLEYRYSSEMVDSAIDLDIEVCSVAAEHITHKFAANPQTTQSFWRVDNNLIQKLFTKEANVIAEATRTIEGQLALLKGVIPLDAWKIVNANPAFLTRAYYRRMVQEAAQKKIRQIFLGKYDVEGIGHALLLCNPYTAYAVFAGKEFDAARLNSDWEIYAPDFHDGEVLAVNRAPQISTYENGVVTNRRNRILDRTFRGCTNCVVVEPDALFVQDFAGDFDGDGITIAALAKNPELAVVLNNGGSI